MEIKNFTEKDFPQIAEIYRQGIRTGMATFEKEVPSWQTWDKNHILQCRIAVFDNDRIMVGWAALTGVSGRCVYAGVAEVSVYIYRDYRGKGVGKILLQKLILQSENAGFWTLQSGIFPENKASIQLHKSCGFREIGYKEKIGQLDGVWKDNILLERRSKIIGIN